MKYLWNGNKFVAVRELKIGDRFVVVSKPVDREEWIPEMNKFLKETLTVCSFGAEKNGIYYKTGALRWYENMIDWEATEKLYVLPEPNKYELKSGDMIVFNTFEKRYVLIETETLHNIKNGLLKSGLNILDENLSNDVTEVVEVYRDGELIMKRKPKEPTEIEMIEFEMRKLADRLKELKGDK